MTDGTDGAILSDKCHRIGLQPYKKFGKIEAGETELPYEAVRNSKPRARPAFSESADFHQGNIVDQDRAVHRWLRMEGDGTEVSPTMQRYRL